MKNYKLPLSLIVTLQLFFSDYCLSQEMDILDSINIDTCIHVTYYKNLIDEKCYLNSRLVRYKHPDAWMTHTDEFIYMNDTLTLHFHYDRTGKLRCMFEECTKTGAECGIYVSFYESGTIRETGKYFPISCNCSKLEEVSIPHEIGLYIIGSRKVGIWIKYNEDGTVNEIYNGEDRKF